MIEYEIRAEQVDDSVLREIHRSMVDLSQRGFALPIRWTLASFKEPATVVSGATSDDGTEITTTTADSDVMPAMFPLPAYLVATDATGMSITGLVPRGRSPRHRE